MGFVERALGLPNLGVGVSTEYGAHATGDGLDVERLWQDYPAYAGFLEVGVEAVKGLDDDAQRWAAQGRPTTYHFLDVNLDEPEDQDPAWHQDVRRLIDVLNPAWLCGDAGMWHLGPRARGHMLLLPPILSDDAASAMADGVQSLRSAVDKEVLPENPPGHVFLGDLHLLDFFARVCDRGDTGMLLDCAHLAIYQRLQGHDALTGLDDFPMERIIELHVAGGTEHAHEGYAFVEDDHTTEVLPDTWRIFDYIVARAPHLKAVVFECERNPLEACLPGFARIKGSWP
ncbi:MAG: DUF692 family multinuclear iron-containing protein [Myxococcota bacterium]